MQIVPKPEFLDPATKFRFFPDEDQERDTSKVPYAYILKRFNSEVLMSPEVVLRFYREAVVECTKILREEDTDRSTIGAHNVILTNGWILVISRRRERLYERIMVNAAGMMGMPTVSKKVLFHIWKRVRPSKALAEFGVAREVSTDRRILGHIRIGVVSLKQVLKLFM
ncbi:uncharacterized protein RSE6_03483 [Rhynchosporium secalis]|uniref:ATP adenylyltransferase C-terminal domain-containing protein n=1 Tax=Rhynchosporium secalis TaxID=38038 RepID=A0A1E1M2V7_RHYSE|nr:uncharacterized protein RSE6_03483 [Rhynchosporium secalis]